MRDTLGIYFLPANASDDNWFKLFELSSRLTKVGPSLGSRLIIFLLFLFFHSLVKNKLLIEINNGQPMLLMWYIFILLFFRILALENVAKILTAGPMLGRT